MLLSRYSNSYQREEGNFYRKKSIFTMKNIINYKTFVARLRVSLVLNIYLYTHIHFVTNILEKMPKIWNKESQIVLLSEIRKEI